MRSRLTTTAATYAVLSLAGSVPLFMPESVALPDAWGGNAPAAFILHGTMRGGGVQGDAGALDSAVQPVAFTLERRAESGLYVVRGGGRGRGAGHNGAARETMFELTASFTHEAGAGHIVRVSGADQARILIDGRLVAGAVHGPGAQSVELDALEDLEDGRSYEIGFVFTDERGMAAFRIETTLHLRSESAPALTSAVR